MLRELFQENWRKCYRTSNRVALTDNASINTSGPAGGGKVIVGGDYHGANPDVKNAEATYVGPKASINAKRYRNGMAAELLFGPMR